VKESRQVDAENRRVIGIAVLREVLRDEDACVIDEGVDTPEPRHAFGDRTLGRPPFSDVAQQMQQPAKMPSVIRWRYERPSAHRSAPLRLIGFTSC